MSESLDVCLVFDSKKKAYWQYPEIKNLVDSDHEIELILIEDNKGDHSRNNHKIDKEYNRLTYSLKSLLRGEFGVLIEVEEFFARKLNASIWPKYVEYRNKNKQNPFDNIRELNNVEHMYFKPNNIGEYIYKFPDEIIQRITEKCDVVVLIGFNRILRGKVLTEPNHGTLSFHGSDFTQYRGRPAGFFQWINGEKSVGLTLQQLTEDLDGGNIVLCDHADISNVESYWEVKLQIHRLYNDMLVRGLNNLSNPEFSTESPKLGKLTYEKEGDELKNVLRCVFTNICARYSNNLFCQINLEH